MEIITVSTIRCPECGFTRQEDIPENSCLWYYTCLGCGTLLRPLEKDCCVFCSYGTFKCIPVQKGIDCNSQSEDCNKEAD